MKERCVAAVVLAMLFASVALANKRQWIPADVVDISTRSNKGGYAVLSVGNGIAGVPITSQTIFYRIETKDIVYILVLTNPKHLLNVTLHGKTWIALDDNGHDAHIIDDARRDVKVPISEKIAKPK